MNTNTHDDYQLDDSFNNLLESQDIIQDKFDSTEILTFCYNEIMTPDSYNEIIFYYVIGK